MGRAVERRVEKRVKVEMREDEGEDKGDGIYVTHCVVNDIAKVEVS